MAWPVRRLIIRLIPCGPRIGRELSPAVHPAKQGPASIRLFFSQRWRRHRQ